MTSRTATSFASGGQAGFARRLRDSTSALHHRAERTGVFRSLVRGTASRRAYALLLRNLLPAYEALELALDRLQSAPGLRHFACAKYFRRRALVADLRALEGVSWRRSLPLLPAGDAYAERIANVAERDAPRLIGHTYARHLGDMGVAPVMNQLLPRTLDLGRDCLGFYTFPEIKDLADARAAFRRGLELAAAEVDDSDVIVAEADRAFGFNIDLSLAVQAAAENGVRAVGAPATGSRTSRNREQPAWRRGAEAPIALGAAPKHG